MPPTPGYAGTHPAERQLFQYTIDLSVQKSRNSKVKTQRKSKPRKRPKSNKRRRAAARNPQESTVPNQAEKKTAEQDGKGQHERSRSQRPGRAAYRRRNERERRQKAKECGQCRDCKTPSIPGKTRCEVCAARHRMSGKQGRERKAQQKEQISGQDPIS